MHQKLSQKQIQEQKLLQQQRITQHHLLTVKLLGMSLTELENNVVAEIDDNPALEEDYNDDNFDDINNEANNDNDNSEEFNEQQERQEELNKALENMGSDDDMNSNEGFNYHDSAEYEEFIYGDTESFIDKLNEQMGELELSETDSNIMEYLIGSLDDDGLLRKDIATIADELAIYEYIDTNTEDVERVLQILQGFDPAGIGARSLQECLRLQVERKNDDKLKEYMLMVIDHYFESFTKKRWSRLQETMKLNDTQMETLINELRKLNPKPGASMGETIGRNFQQITPDFIINTTDDGEIYFDINNGNLPNLTVSESFEEMMNNYRNVEEGTLNRSDREAMNYLRSKLEKAKSYISAIKQRQYTMYLTMQAIINWQRKFFLEGDESDLRPMILKDIADATGLDISTISRVSNDKYAQTRWGTFPLRFFFNDSYTNEEGEEMSTRKIKIALKEVIDNEDKQHPLSDLAIVKIMTKQGFPVARRTIAKYRDQLGIPKSTLRKS